MLIGFSAENFKCYNDEINVSLIAENSARNCFYIGNVPIISHMAICGENSTGKSSLISVLTLISDIVQQGKIPDYAKGWYNRLNRSNRNRETTLELIVSMGSSTYSYGIKTCLNTGVIYREWINELSTNGTSLLLLGRDEDNAFSLARCDEFSKDDHQRFRLYTEDLSSKELLLTKLARVSFREESGLNLIKKFHAYISGFIINLDRKGSPLKIRISQDTNVTYELLSLLNSMGADVTNILLKNTSLPHCISKEELSALNEGSGILCRDGNDLSLIVRNENGETEISQLIMEHCINDASYRLSYADESSSNRKLIDLAVLFCNEDSSQNLLLVDDIDEGLSLSIMTGLFSYIDYEFTEKNQQIIFTARDSEDVYPVYCLEPQNIFHTCRDSEVGFTLNETHADNIDFDDRCNSQEYDLDNDSQIDLFFQDTEDEVQDNIETDPEAETVSSFSEEEVEDDYHSRASSLPYASPLDDREYEAWSEVGSDDYENTDKSAASAEDSENELSEPKEGRKNSGQKQPRRTAQKDKNSEGSKKNSKQGRKKREQHEAKVKNSEAKDLVENTDLTADTSAVSVPSEEKTGKEEDSFSQSEIVVEQQGSENSDAQSSEQENPEVQQSDSNEERKSRNSAAEKKTGRRGPRKNAKKQTDEVDENIQNDAVLTETDAVLSETKESETGTDQITANADGDNTVLENTD